MEKYQDLAKELRKVWNTSVTVAPIAVGALGAVCTLEKELVKTKHRQERNLKSASCCIAGLSANIKERFGSY